ncbi:cell wall hydrolase [Pleomorphomonas sp. NRK KF1]|uniref:cell wall hydrolase n=1 Tax=Pleomorphomonas sp. NRK KF1 TaxID=2943000 RepID=UPI002044785B|nr:cell wall hydrolase [Pleomorphomonas sp. NRK KF1]MCM5555433.1 cell wall hydrolase [Pleomorphomonas sp. NRK KF1]
MRRVPRTRVRPGHGRVGLAAAGALFVVAVAFPTSVAYQDIASLVVNSISPETRWAVTLGVGPGGESKVVAPRLGEVDGSSARLEMNDGSIVIEGMGDVITGAVSNSAFVPDEDRIDRSWKGDLPMSVTTPPTARGFSAGSLTLGDASRLTPPSVLPTMAFSASSAPLSVLAVSRFIGPKPTTAVADLAPTTLPQPKPDQTFLVAASYPSRAYAPAETGAAASALLAAYAPDSSVVSQDMFASLFAMPGDKPEPPPPVVRPGDHWWAANPLPANVWDDAQQKCLAEAIYFESRSEPRKGQIAVAQVVLNRVKNPAYPETICKVVYQNRDMRNECQFSFACDGRRDVIFDKASWRRAKQLAGEVTSGAAWLDDVGTATHYHATYVRPNWASVFKKKAKIGLHVFYQTINGGWS